MPLPEHYDPQSAQETPCEGDWTLKAQETCQQQEDDAFWESLQTELEKAIPPQIPPPSPVSLPPPYRPLHPPPLSPPSFQDMEEAMEVFDSFYQEVDTQTEAIQQQHTQQEQAQRLAMPYPQCLTPLTPREQTLRCPLQRASELPGGCASNNSPVGGNAFVVRPDREDPYEAQRCGNVKRVIYLIVIEDCAKMSTEYHGTIFTSRHHFNETDKLYVDQQERVARDIRRQTHYNTEDPAWLSGGQFLYAHVDFNDVIPGFQALGIHKVQVYMPNDRLDNYGPLFSLNGILMALGYRAGGSSAVCLSAMLRSDCLPTEIRMRLITLTTNQLRSQRFREFFLDIQALKYFLVAFGYKHQTAGGKASNGGKELSSNSVAARIRLQLCSEFVATDVSLRLLSAPLTDA